jgi:hypothetical protein
MLSGIVSRGGDSRWEAEPELDYLDLIVSAEKAGYDRGRASVLSGCYEAGYVLGWDHGLGARQDCRALVRGIIDGYGEGLAERHRMLDELRDRDRVRHLAGKAATR